MRTAVANEPRWDSSEASVRRTSPDPLEPDRIEPELFAGRAPGADATRWTTAASEMDDCVGERRNRNREPEHSDSRAPGVTSQMSRKNVECPGRGAHHVKAQRSEATEDQEAGMMDREVVHPSADCLRGSAGPLAISRSLVR